MSNTQHTPGPWAFYRQSSCDRGDSYGVKAPAPHHWVVPTLNINPADARLIAAAPELLEFAEWVLSLKTGGMIEGRARAAIAKVTGEQV